MSGSESIMSIFVLSPALGTPLTLPTAAHPPPLLSSSNCKHPELETRYNSEYIMIDGDVCCALCCDSIDALLIKNNDVY